MRRDSSNNVRGEDVSYTVEKDTQRERTGGMMSWGKELQRNRGCIFLQVWPHHILLLHTLKKVASLIFSTVDIVISPAEVIHHQCNISLSLSLSLSLLFLLYLHHLSGPSVSHIPNLFQLILFSPSTASLSHFLLSKTTVPKPSYLTGFQRQRPTLGTDCRLTLK